MEEEKERKRRRGRLRKKKGTRTRDEKQGRTKTRTAKTQERKRKRERERERKREREKETNPFNNGDVGSVQQERLLGVVGRTFQLAAILILVLFFGLVFEMHLKKNTKRINSKNRATEEEQKTNMFHGTALFVSFCKEKKRRETKRRKKRKGEKNRANSADFTYLLTHQKLWLRTCG
jgi:hypothetical protein